MELACDVLVVGGGCGGLAAALAASDLGRHVVLTEAGSWLGGQLTAKRCPRMSIHGWSTLVQRPDTGSCVKQYGHDISEPDG